MIFLVVTREEGICLKYLITEKTSMNKLNSSRVTQEMVQQYFVVEKSTSKSVYVDHKFFPHYADRLVFFTTIDFLKSEQMQMTNLEKVISILTYNNI